MDFKFDLQIFANEFNPTDSEKGLFNGKDAQPAQFKWGQDSVGIFAVTLKNGATGVSFTANIADQNAPVAAVMPKTGYNYYVVATYDAPDTTDDTDAAGLKILGLYKVYNNDGTPVVEEYGTSSIPDDWKAKWAEGIDETNCFGKASINIKAPAAAVTIGGTAEVDGQAIPTSITNLAAGSTIADDVLGTGDKVSTASLKAGEFVTIGEDNSYIAATSGAMTFVQDESGELLQSGSVMLSDAEELENAPKNRMGVALAVGGTAVLTTGVKPVDVALKVTGGKVSSIKIMDNTQDKDTDFTGLNVVLTNATGKGDTITYEALNAAGTMFSRTVVDNTGTETVTYLDIAKAGSEIYSASWKNGVNTASDALDFKTNGKHVTYVALGKITGDDPKLVFDKDKRIFTYGDAIDPKDGASIVAGGAADNYYLKVTSTTKDGVTTISGIDLMHAAANGALSKVNYPLQGTIDLTDAADAVVKYTKPANSLFNVVAEGVAFGSAFSGLTDGDKITTAGTDAQALKAGTYTVYSYDDTNKYQVIEKVAVSGNGVKVKIADGGSLESIAGLTDKVNEQVTLTRYTAEGLETIVYKMTKEHELTETRTASDGTKTVSTKVVAADATVDKDTFAPADVISTTISSAFDWSLNKSTTGYFAVSNGVAKVAAGTTNLTKSNAGKVYVKVAIAENAAGDSHSIKVASIDAGVVKYTKDEDAGTEKVELAQLPTAFQGSINITAPKGIKLNLDATDDDFYDENVTTPRLVLSNVAAGSDLTLNNNDSVTTASLNAKEKEGITLGGKVYTAGTNGALSFTVSGTNYNLNKGTVIISATAADPATKSVFVGDKEITSTKGNIFVTGNGNKYTIGDLADGESFTVAGVSYTKSGTSLFTATTAGKLVYNLGKGNSIASDKLEDTTKWVETVATYTTVDEVSSSKFGQTTVNLADADKRIVADTKANNKYPTNTDNVAYKFAMDKNTSKNTKESTTAALNATVVTTVSDTYQETVGKVAVIDDTHKTTEYAAGNVSQTIKVAKDWKVTDGKGDDTIIGAASGENVLNVTGGGNDTVKLGNAAEEVVFDGIAGKGTNTVSAYASGKDKITVSANFGVKLDTAKGGNVYLVADGGAVTDANKILLNGVGNGKAVAIKGAGEYENYYFGNGSTTAGATFNYDGDKTSHYYGNESGKNVLKVGTLKDFNSKNNINGAVVEIDMTTGHYEKIQTVNASGSANAVELIAAETGSTLMGGSYVSELIGGVKNDTLVGGSGIDTFVFDAATGKLGNDVVKNYTTGKDVLSFADGAEIKDFAVSGNDVVLSNDNKESITITGAVNKAITVFDQNIADDNPTAEKIAEATSYRYVGKQGAATVSNTFTADLSKMNTDLMKDDDTKKFVFEKANNYYYGNKTTSNATSTAAGMDTLKITGNFDKADKLYVDLNAKGGDDAAQYTSIEAIDASGLKASSSVTNLVSKANLAKTMGVDVKASENGTRFTGSAFDDKFTCGKGDDYIIYKKGQGEDTIEDFGKDTTVGDVIQFNGLNAKDVASIAAQLNEIAKAGSSIADISLNNGAVKLHIGVAQNSTFTASGTSITGKKTQA